MPPTSTSTIAGNTTGDIETSETATNYFAAGAVIVGVIVIAIAVVVIVVVYFVRSKKSHPSHPSHRGDG